jgi:Beta-lactamase
MARSGALAARVPNDLAVAYEFVDEEYRALSPDYLNVASAGFFFTTGTDMAHFLIAHLRGGAYENGRILQPETVDLMHAQHFTQSPGTSGWGYGIWEDLRGGRRALLHDGGGKGYKALMYLLPGQDAGFFLAYNLADRHEDGVLHERLITRFRELFCPVQPKSAPVYEHESTEQFVREYLYVRRARTTMEKFISVVNRLRIARGPNGTLTMTGASGGPITLIATAAQSFRRTDDRGMVEFESIGGNSAHRLVLITDSEFPAVYERIPLIGTLRAQLIWIVGMLLAFLYAAVWRPLAIVMRGAFHEGWDAKRWSTWLAGIAGALNLMFLVAFPLAFLGRMEGGVPEFLYGVPPVAAALLFIAPITAMLGIATAIAVAGVWLDGQTSITGRVAHSVVAIALLSFVVFAWYWHLEPMLES